MNILVPFWFMRFLVRKFPWLLAENGQVTRSKDVGVGEFLFKISFSDEDKRKYREIEARREVKNRR
jgi:hypothetical protein